MILLLAMSHYVQADGVTAVLKGPTQIYRLDATTGAYKGTIAVNNAIGVGCDGEYIAALLANGSVKRYDAKSGTYLGTIQVAGDPQSVQVTGGIIIVRTEKQLQRYKASNGTFLGLTKI